jgi:hypothetical protein
LNSNHPSRKPYLRRASHDEWDVLHARDQSRDRAEVTISGILKKAQADAILVSTNIGDDVISMRDNQS